MKNQFSNNAAHVLRLKTIERLINEMDLQQAAVELNQAASSTPNDPRLYLLASQLATASNNPDGSLKAALKAYSLAPQWYVASICLAEAYSAHPEVQHALPLAKQAVSQASAQKSLDLQLLHKAAGIAYRVGDYGSALTWLQNALDMHPSDIGSLYKMGLALHVVGQFKQAVICFSEVIKAQPDNINALKARLRAAIADTDMAVALQDSKALLEFEPSNVEYIFYGEVAEGKTPATQPGSLISQIFDSNAYAFDQQMVVGMGYKLPRDIAQRIQLWYPDRKQDILDLGCGTGLMGACLGPIEGVLVGVDLSEQMIAQAAKHGVYDKFHQVNLLDALQATPESLYDVITALDVLIYVGDLATVIPNAYRVISPGGRFVFSCETNQANAANFSLNAGLRYTHQSKYVVSLLNEAGFTDIGIEEITLRQEQGNPVLGFLAIASKPTNRNG